MSTAEIQLPAWSVTTPKRRAHIARVTALAIAWADALGVDETEREAWSDAARWHDALRDAEEHELRAIVPNLDWPASLLHGPAAAAKLSEDGERRTSVLDAIRWHTVGNARWDRTGRVLYMADFLEPGRRFDRERRARIAAGVPSDLDGAFREVVHMRLAERVGSGERLLPATSELWESVQ
jgi:HD superfamily phosphohydrolase YqeK